MLPKSIKIGTQIWEVSEQKRKHNSDFHEGTYGYTIDKDNTIVLDVEMPLSRKRTTLLHELLHAIRFTYGGVTTPGKSANLADWEHYFIGLYEEPLITVLQENPVLADFLLGRENENNNTRATKANN